MCNDDGELISTEGGKMDFKNLQYQMVAGAYGHAITHAVITTIDGDCVAELHIDGNRWPSQKVTETNARRLVACWNACAGIPTEFLEEPDPQHQPAIYQAQAARISQLVVASDSEIEKKAGPTFNLVHRLAHPDKGENLTLDDYREIARKVLNGEIR